MTKHKDSLFDFLFALIVGTILTFSMTSGLLAASILGPLNWSFLWVSASVILVFRLILSNRITFALGLGAIILAFLLAFLDLKQNQYSAPWFLRFGSEAFGLFSFLNGKGPLLSVDKLFVATLLTLFIGLFVMLNIHGVFHVTTITLTGIALFTVPYYLNYPASPRDQYLFLGCFLALLLKRMNLLTLPPEDHVTRRKQNTSFSLFAIFLATGCVLIALILPKPAIETNGLVEKSARAVVDTVAYARQETKVLSFTEGEKDIGGPITMGKEPVMRVKAEEPLYLSTVYKDTYTGKSWKNTLDKKQALSLDDEGFYETSLYSLDQTAFQMQQMNALLLSEGTEEAVEIHPTMRSVYIEMLDHRTRNVFTPPFRSKLIVGYDIDLQRDQAGALSSKFIMYQQQVYTQNYLSWISSAVDYSGLPKTLTNDDIADHSLEQYLTLPDEISLRTIDLTHQLTDDYASTYEKLAQLERYLSQFPYTLEPEPIPQDVDFVDYFLFEGQEGYCVYYASSMAIMGRIIGIPTRYVEGYLMPQQPEADGRYLVTNEQAHAWVEAYFPEFGWIAFEPTAGYYGTADSPIQPPILPVEEPPTVPPLVPEDIPDTPNTENSTSSEPDEAKIPENNNPQKKSLLFTFMAIGAFSVIALVGTVWFFYRRYQNHVAKQLALSPRQQALDYFLQIRRALSTLGHPSRVTETALHFAQRVQKELPISPEEPSLFEIAEIYTEIVYSQNPILPEEIKTVERYRKGVLKVLQKEKKIAFLIQKYLRLLY